MLSRSFFQRDPVTCARELIGCRLQWGDRSGIVTETEAYDAVGDEAAHTFFRPSARMFVEKHRAGDAYVYFNYGVHWMLNVMVKGSRTGFVLIRGIEPLTGIEEMKQARHTDVLSQLCSGPGKLAKAFGITGESHGMDLCANSRFAFHRGKIALEAAATPRIGITRSVDLPWRFYALGNVHISAHPKGWKGDRPVRRKPGRPSD